MPTDTDDSAHTMSGMHPTRKDTLLYKYYYNPRYAHCPYTTTTNDRTTP